jgi:hypothetical protein
MGLVENDDAVAIQISLVERLSKQDSIRHVCTPFISHARLEAGRETHT